MYQTTSEPSAYIVNSSDKGRKKIYPNNKIYLENGKEFQIELFNPTNQPVLAKININGVTAAESGLVIRPAQRIFLDCFVADRKKFTFNTYDVENTTEAKNAIANNGVVEIFFYKEKQHNWSSNTLTISNDWTKPWYGIPNTIRLYNGDCTATGDYIVYGGIFNETKNDCSYLSSVNTPTMDFCSKSSIETGRVEKGANSNQKFENVCMDFEIFHTNSVSYQILPESKRPIEVAELKKNKFCTNCGSKVDCNFCGNCGKKV